MVTGTLERKYPSLLAFVVVPILAMPIRGSNMKRLSQFTLYMASNGMLLLVTFTFLSLFYSSNTCALGSGGGEGVEMRYRVPSIQLCRAWNMSKWAAQKETMLAGWTRGRETLAGLERGQHAIKLIEYELYHPGIEVYRRDV